MLENFKDMYKMLWDFIYEIFAIFGVELSNPYEA